MYGIGFCITMYDEANVVQHNIDKIKKRYGDKSIIIVVQSDSGQEIKNADVFERTSNLGTILDPYKVAANSVIRNYNIAFNTLYSLDYNWLYITALTGDTYISDLRGLERLSTKMHKMDKNICVSQAIGQNFHASDDNPPDKIEGRHQYDGISDFMPQFFLMDGGFACTNKLFSKTEVTNPYCTEQCLGDELSKYIAKPFDKDVHIIAKNAYDFNDGIIYNYND